MHQVHGHADFLNGPAGVFVDDMNLEISFGVMGFQGLKMGLGVLPAPGLRVEGDGHGLPEHRQPLLKLNDSLFVHEGEAPFRCRQRIPEHGEKDQVCFQALHNPFQGKLHQERGAGRGCVLQGGLNNLERHMGCLLTDGHGLLQSFPVAVQHDGKEIIPPGFQADASLLTCQPLAVTAQTPEHQGQTARRTVAVALVDQALIDLPEINHQMLLTLRIRRALLEQLQEIPFHLAKTFEQFFRAVLDLVTDIGREDGFLGKQPLSGHVLQGSQHPLGLGFIVMVIIRPGKGT